MSQRNINMVRFYVRNVGTLPGPIRFAEADSGAGRGAHSLNCVTLEDVQLSSRAAWAT